MSMSLDGFIAGPNVGVDRPMGEGGERLHEWLSTCGRGDPRVAEVAVEMSRCDYWGRDDGQADLYHRRGAVGR